MDFAASKGKSMILNRISSAIVVPLVAPNSTQDVLGVLWLDSETLAQFQPKDLELVVAIAHQASMFIEINILGEQVKQETIARERFSRLLSPNITERVMIGQLEVRLGGQRINECTVFNSNIRGFTAMSENTQPEELVDTIVDEPTVARTKIRTRQPRSSMLHFGLHAPRSMVCLRTTSPSIGIVAFAPLAPTARDVSMHVCYPRVDTFSDTRRRASKGWRT